LNKYLSHTDPQLCDLLRQGDREAFEMIYERYWQSLYVSANRLLRVRTQAEDIVQDLFINLWQKRAEYRIDNLEAYLRKALRSRVFNYLKRDQAKNSFYEPFEDMQQAAFSADQLVRDKEFLKLLADYIASLPSKRREIFLLKYRDQMNTAEIADQLGVSLKTVQNQLHTALTGLKDSLAVLLLIVISHPS
jgi:RNA polymerase sigma-70 factor (ECF subfamily)